MLYDNACKEAKRLEKRILQLNTQLKKLPDGKLYCSRDGESFKWYHHTPEKDYHLGRRKRRLAEALAKKKYLTLLKEDLEHEKRAIDFYLRHHQPRPWKAERLTIEKPQYQELLLPVFKFKSQEFEEWKNSPYPTNTINQNLLVHDTPTHIKVRSKSEALIAMVLCNHNIPWRYECELQLGTHTCYPDFTILHPKTGVIYYWEHWGMIDSPSYSQYAFQKMQVYSNHGIYPTINLITTYETKEHPLTLDTIEKIVEDYFK